MNDQTLTFGVVVGVLLLVALMLVANLGPLLASAFTLDVVR